MLKNILRKNLERNFFYEDVVCQQRSTDWTLELNDHVNHALRFKI